MAEILENSSQAERMSRRDTPMQSRTLPAPNTGELEGLNPRRPRPQPATDRLTERHCYLERRIDFHLERLRALIAAIVKGPNVALRAR
jgi:hypothetical protein